VIDTISGKPLEFASVSLTYPDSLRILASVSTDSSGRFILTHLKAGKYTLTCAYVGYQKKSETIEILQDLIETSLRPVALHSSMILHDAVILSEKPVIKFEPGKIVFDVAKTMTDGAETALESMQKIPGVTVTQDGSVEVKGKGGVKYLVDGKPSPMAQTNPEAFLRSIPAKNIESIEINTNPSAKYDASGTAAVINIHLKKGKMEGLNGSVSAGIGTVFDKYNLSGNINYKKGKINVFANAYFRDEHSDNYRISDRQVTVSDTISRYHSTGSGTSHSISGSGKAGIEYSIDKHNSLTYAIDIDYWQYSSNGILQMSVSDHATPTLFQRISGNDEISKDLSVTNSLNYRRTYDSSDRAWTIDLAHTIQDQDSREHAPSLAYDNMKNELTQFDFYNATRNYGTNHNLLIQTDYNSPLKLKGTKIETGLKEELNLHNTTNDVYSTLSNTELIDSGRSTIFRYTESISAAYFTYSTKLKKLSYSAGIRWEHAYIKSDFNNNINRSYGDLFPSANAGWAFNEKHNINLSYSRRINRPGFWMLSNASSYTPYTIWSGNPNIKPAYTNSIEFSYNAQIKKQSINFTANYSHEDGSFQYITHTLPTGITFSHYENAGTQDNAYAGVNVSLKLTKWWDGSVYTGYGYHWFAYSLDGTMIRTHAGSGNMSGNMSFKFWKNASLQLWGWSSTGWVMAQTRYRPVGSVSITLKKKFLKEKLTVSLSCRDVFHTQQWESNIYTPSLSTYSHYWSNSTVAYLTLTYQFGSQTFTPETKGKSNRMGGGGGGPGGN
jgi:outer membrane receptor protein involved in Fe transport